MSYWKPNVKWLVSADLLVCWCLWYDKGRGKSEPLLTEVLTDVFTFSAPYQYNTSPWEPDSSKGVCCIIYCQKVTDLTTFLVVWGSGENHVRKSWWNANLANFVFLYSLLVVSRTWTEVDWCVALSLLNTNSSIPALQRHFRARLSTRLVLMQKGVGARLGHT